MLVACRLAGLSALEGHYAGVNARAQSGPTQHGVASRARIPPSNAKPLPQRGQPSLRRCCLKVRARATAT